MFRNRTRLKPLGQIIICRGCGRQRRAASTGKTFREPDLDDAEPMADLQPRSSSVSSRQSWSDRLQSSTSSRSPLHLQPEPRLNDLRPSSQRLPASTTRSAPSHDDVPSALSRSYTQLLRRLLDLHSWEDPDPAESPQAYLFRKFCPPQSQLSRQDIHSIVHACIRNGRPMLAARFLGETLAEMEDTQSRVRVARTTLGYLFKACAYHIEEERQKYLSMVCENGRNTLDSYSPGSDLEPVREFVLEPSYGGLIPSISLPPHSGPTSGNGPSTPRSSLVPSDTDRPLASLNCLIALLRRLQDWRNPRPIAAYRSLIAAALALKRPDIAAGVYVGMVEEWVMEGRLAMGARMEDFHPGGGPPQEGRDELELASDLLKSWWKGIRSWSLPGEVLSPHGRIDMWHPRKTSPSDRLRHFPLPNPTSPPSLVPAPDEELLNMIIVNLHLDSQTSSLEDFTASMRACATLANTIHSRTLPYMSKASLITVLGQVPYLPKVYPEDVNPDGISRRDEWAYTAYTHVHLALQSLLWTPTTPVTALEAAAAETRERAPVLGTNIYGMAPLSLPACRALMKYGFRKLQSLSAAVPTFRYLSASFGPRNLTGVLADMFHAAVTSRNENMMVQSKRMVFATETDRRLDPEGDPRRREPSEVSSLALGGGEGVLPMLSTTAQGNTSSPPSDEENAMPSLATSPDPTKTFVVSTAKIDDFIHQAVTSQVGLGSESSLEERDESQLRFMALFRYYVWMNKPRMVEKLVHELIPDVDQPGGHRPDPVYAETKPPVYLRPRTYKIMLWSLRMTRQTALAQKVFHHALLADSYWKQRYGTSGRDRENHRLIIHAYAIMINVWKDVFHYSPTPTERDEAGRNLRPDPGLLEGFSVPPGFDEDYRDSPHRQGGAMILYIYALARAAWLEAARDPLSQRFNTDRAAGIAPDKMFLETVSDALAPRWGAHLKLFKICDFKGRPVEPLQGAVLDELRSFINDMEMFGVPVPSLLRIRAMNHQDAIRHPRYHLTIPRGRTVRVMNALRHHRQLQDQAGRISVNLDRAERRWDEREPAADLWWWQTRGGGRLPRGSMRRASFRWKGDAKEATDRDRKRIVGTWVAEKDGHGQSTILRRTASELSNKSQTWEPEPMLGPGADDGDVPVERQIRRESINVNPQSKRKNGEEAEAHPFTFKPSYS